MDTLTERETEREDVPRRQDGSIDLNELARGLLEDCLNAVMSEQADELLGEGNRRNGYRERSLNTCVGRITLRIPKLREGTYFPDDVLRPYSRTDRAWIGYTYLDDSGRTKPAFLNSTGAMYPKVECSLKLLYQCT